MKGMTVRQPWAWAIAEAGKDVENRTTIWRQRGLLAIHAGLRVHDEWVDTESAATMRRALDGASDDAWNRRMATGVIVAVVDYEGGHPAAFGCCDSQWRHHGPGVTHLLFRNPRRLTRPVPCRGKQGLWDVPADVEAAVLADLATQTA